MYIAIIQKTYNQFIYDHSNIARIYELFKREYYWRGIKKIII